MADLRKTSRIDAQHFISYDILNADGETVGSGMSLSRNLSRSGVQMEDRNEIPLETPVLLHLAVGESIVDVEGVVRHVEKADENTYHIGIEFAEIEDMLIDQIAKYYPNITKR